MVVVNIAMDRKILELSGQGSMKRWIFCFPTEKLLLLMRLKKVV